jgi:uncharacterized protein YraI
MSIRQSVRAILAAAALLGAVGLAEAQTIAYADPGTTNLRAGPGTNYARIGSVYGGTQVYVHYCEYGWCFVRVNGRDGWMAQSRLRFADTRGPVVVVPQPQPYYVPRYEPFFGFSFGFDDRYYPRHDRNRPRYDRRRRDGREHREEGWSSEHSGPYWPRRGGALQRWLDR